MLSILSVPTGWSRLRSCALRSLTPRHVHHRLSRRRGTAAPATTSRRVLTWNPTERAWRSRKDADPTRARCVKTRSTRPVGRSGKGHRPAEATRQADQDDLRLKLARRFGNRINKPLEAYGYPTHTGAATHDPIPLDDTRPISSFRIRQRATRYWRTAAFPTRMENSLHDALITSTSTDVSGQRCSQLFTRWHVLHQGVPVDDLTGSAVPTLKSPIVRESGPEHVRSWPKPLDSGDRPRDTDSQGEASQCGASRNQDGAGTALAHTTRRLSARQSQFTSQQFEKAGAGLDFYRALDPIDYE